MRGFFFGDTHGEYTASGKTWKNSRKPAANLAGVILGCAAHRSMVPGHRIMQEHLGVTPLLGLNLRLGEGAGAALAMNLVEAVVAILTEVATFAEAQVAGADK